MGRCGSAWCCPSSNQSAGTSRDRAVRITATCRRRSPSPPRGGDPRLGGASGRGKGRRTTGFARARADARPALRAYRHGCPVGGRHFGRDRRPARSEATRSSTRRGSSRPAGRGSTRPPPSPRGRQRPRLGPPAGRDVATRPERRRPRVGWPEQLHLRPTLHARPGSRLERHCRRLRLHARRPFHGQPDQPQARGRTAAGRALLRPLRKCVPRTTLAASWSPPRRVGRPRAVPRDAARRPQGQPGAHARSRSASCSHRSRSAATESRRPARCRRGRRRVASRMRPPSRSPRRASSSRRTRGHQRSPARDGHAG